MRLIVQDNPFYKPDCLEIFYSDSADFFGINKWNKLKSLSLNKLGLTDDLKDTYFACLGFA